jgi:hypothetical protein
MLFAGSLLLSRSRRSVRLTRGVAALAAALSLPATAAAEPGAPSPGSSDFLSWQAPVGCSTAAAVRERVGELLGQPELDLRHVQRVEGRVTEAANGWTLHLTLVDAHGQRERTLDSEHCQDLAEAAAVAITLAFEAARAEAEAASAATSETEARAAAEPEPAPAPSQADAASSESVAALASEPAPDFAFGAELLFDANSLPGITPGASLFGTLRWSALRLSLFAAWWPENTESVAPEQDVSFSLLSAGLRACYTLGRGLVDTALCAGAEIGQLSASGAGLFRAQSVDDLWLAPQLGLELGVPLGPAFAVLARADAVVPLLRHGYAVNETDNVHETPAVAVRVAVGVAVSF